MFSLIIQPVFNLAEGSMKGVPLLLSCDSLEVLIAAQSRLGGNDIGFQLILCLSSVCLTDLCLLHLLHFLLASLQGYHHPRSCFEGPCAKLCETRIVLLPADSVKEEGGEDTR